jgi:hypothetical protein
LTHPRRHLRGLASQSQHARVANRSGVRSYHWLSLTMGLRWRLACVGGAGPDGSESWSPIVSESDPLLPGEIPIDWIRWTPVGPVSVDQAGDLVFPSVDPVPGIYRFTISDGSETCAEYIGQAAVSLVTRFGLYRSRGKKPSLPLASKTTSRNARHLLDALAAGRSVSVALVDDHVTAPDGQVVVIDLADKALRGGLEKKLIAWLCTTGTEVLNRDFNPGWRGAAGKPPPERDAVPPLADEVIDQDYLPFTAGQLAGHFAPVAAMGDHLAYYRASAKRAANFKAAPLAGTPAELGKVVKWGRQMEKDERFWVAATLMQLFHAPNRIELFARMLRHCLGDTPPGSLPSWEEALGHEQFLYFEANLPSPAGYSDQLGRHLDEHILVPYLREAAKLSRQRGRKLEGATNVDALLTAPGTGFAVLFEAKVLSDISPGVQFDVLRNQIARTIDVMLEPNAQLRPPLSERRPDRTCFVLITPEIFRRNPDSRLYGWLLPAYQQDPALLQRHLAHRQPAELASVPQRLGWLTWEDCNHLHPGACPWLPAQQD